MHGAMVAFAECLAVIVPCRRRNGRVAEALVSLETGRPAGGDVVTGGVESVVEALLRDVVIRGWRRRGISGYVGRVRAAGEGDGRS